jgi:hypothetical protein
MTDRVSRIDGAGLSRRYPLRWVALAFTLAELLDLVTSQVARELNPIAAALLQIPLGGLVSKLALAAFVVAVADIVARRRPGLALALLLFGTLAGLVGAVSNTHLTPFVTG